MPRNALRRPVDRAESLLVFVLVFTFLAGGPALAWWAGHADYRAQLRAQQWEREHVSSVDAVLIPKPATAGTATVVPDTGWATWTAPDGTARSGVVPAGPGARTGDRVIIWVDENGTPRAAPARRQPATRAVLTGGAVLLCLAAGLGGLHRIGRGLLDRRRDRAWTREWLEVGPRWSRDRR
jgi:hypothetical protein